MSVWLSARDGGLLTVIVAGTDGDPATYDAAVGYNHPLTYNSHRHRHTTSEVRGGVYRRRRVQGVAESRCAG